MYWNENKSLKTTLQYRPFPDGSLVYRLFWKEPLHLNSRIHSNTFNVNAADIS